MTQEFEANGFRLVDTQDFLQENYLLRFERRASSGEAEDHPQSSAWKPVEGQLLTRWAKQVAPDKAWEEYPRPQLVRHAWSNLNGLWDYAIRPKDESAPQSYEGKILVPFAVESALSGVKKPVTPEQRLWYHRTFELPDAAQGKRWLLHFGAVDWHAQVWVNGRNVGEHRGGYDSFTFDVTGALQDSGSPAPDGQRLGSDRCRVSAARQAGTRAARHLVHGGHWHLADRLARAGAPNLHRVHPTDSACRPRRTADFGRCCRNASRDGAGG